jgi:hypothetical protein
VIKGVKSSSTRRTHPSPLGGELCAIASTTLQAIDALDLDELEAIEPRVFGRD